MTAEDLIRGTIEAIDKAIEECHKHSECKTCRYYHKDEHYCMMVCGDKDKALKHE